MSSILNVQAVAAAKYKRKEKFKLTNAEVNQLVQDNAIFLVKNNSEQIAEMLSGIDCTKPLPEISAQLASAITTISVSIASGLTLRLLDSYGVIDLENAKRVTPKSNFQVVHSVLEKPSNT